MPVPHQVRFSLFQRSAAPIRAAYMGYPGPCGAPNIHYTYVDAAVAPARYASQSARKAIRAITPVAVESPPPCHPRYAHFFTEKLTLLPHTYYLNDYAQSHALEEVWMGLEKVGWGWMGLDGVGLGGMRGGCLGGFGIILRILDQKIRKSLIFIEK